MQRHAQTSGFCFRERGSVDGDVAFCRVAAEIDADDAAGAVFDGEVDDVHCFEGGVAAVDGEDEGGG